MNKIISNNPILRFKDGKKIQKFQRGGESWAGYYIVGNWSKSSSTKNRTNVASRARAREQAKFNRNYPYSYSENYTNASSYFPAVIQDARFNDFSPWPGGRSGLVVDLDLGNFAWHPKKIRVSYSPTYSPTLRSLNTSTANNTTALTISPSNIYWYMKGFRNRVQGLGLKSREDVKAMQRMLGTKADGVWGRNTEKAYINKFKFTPDLESPSLSEELNVTIPNIVPKKEYLQLELLRNATAIPQYDITSTLPSTILILNLPTTIPLPLKQYNRSEIRLYMRDKGLNPYSFTGALRRALRMVKNGLGTEEDKAIVKGMGFKRGGSILPSRDPVKRFKMREGSLTF